MTAFGRRVWLMLVAGGKVGAAMFWGVRASRLTLPDEPAPRDDTVGKPRSRAPASPPRPPR